MIQTPDYKWRATPIFASPILCLTVLGSESAKTFFETTVMQADKDQIDRHGPITHYHSRLSVFKLYTELAKLQAELERAATFAYRDLLNFSESGPLKITNAWFNLCEPGGEQAAHNHANCLMSATYYLHADANTEISFFHPKTAPSMHPELVDQASNNDNAHGLEFHVHEQVFNPQVGELYLWPSELQHGYGPNKTPGRLSLSFNLMPAYLNLDYQVQI